MADQENILEERASQNQKLTSHLEKPITVKFNNFSH